jgi:hypothetical protein
VQGTQYLVMRPPKSCTRHFACEHTLVTEAASLGSGCPLTILGATAICSDPSTAKENEWTNTFREVHIVTHRRDELSLLYDSDYVDHTHLSGLEDFPRTPSTPLTWGSMRPEQVMSSDGHYLWTTNATNFSNKMGACTLT